MANETAVTFNFLGGQFMIGDGANVENFTLIKQVQACDFTGNKVDTAEVTSADDIDRKRRYQGQLEAEGECDIVIFWNPQDASHILLLAAKDGNRHDFKRVAPGGFGTKAFAGTIVSMTQKEELDKPTMMSVKIQISGPVTNT